ncbi:unnamed protein product [Triticum turgidum subsp. durum]|uniref:Uncharacterized protein n=1 Tax=Triticum turgidum subsp. durum TaxID=4567 RepID=A0A9R1S4C0_TRITD|nr:unnamed protein product [Triticum turgidum subsp. durum]
MDNCADQNLAQRSIGFFRVPGLFVRLSSKGLNAVDPDSVWSPTSPLDFKNLPSSNTVGTNLKPTGLLGIEADLLKLRTGSQRVGLGLVDALTADEGSLHFGAWPEPEDDAHPERPDGGGAQRRPFQEADFHH